MPIPTPTRSLPRTAVDTEPGAAAMTIHPARLGTAEASTVNLDRDTRRIKTIKRMTCSLKALREAQ